MHLPGKPAATLVAASVLLAHQAVAIDNGIGTTPPRGWRSWNQFQCGINQTLVEKQYDALVSRSRKADGVS